MAEPATTPFRQQQIAELKVARRRAELVGDTELVARCDSMMVSLSRPPRPGIKMRHGARPGEIERFKNGRWVVTGA